MSVSCLSNENILVYEQTHELYIYLSGKGVCALRTQPCSQGFAQHEGPNTLCYVEELTGPKSVRTATGVCVGVISLLTSYRSFTLKHWRNYCIIVLSYFGLFWTFLLTKKKKPILKFDLVPPICLQSTGNHLD